MATREQVATLKYFKWDEFKHAELVEWQALQFLELVRGLYGAPLTVTSDGRSKEENDAASGSSPTSLHLQGRAFDLRYPPDSESVWRLVKAVQLAASSMELGVELELVKGATDAHVHLGLYRQAKQSRLIVAAD